MEPKNIDIIKVPNSIRIKYIFSVLYSYFIVIPVLTIGKIPIFFDTFSVLPTFVFDSTDIRFRYVSKPKRKFHFFVVPIFVINSNGLTNNGFRYCRLFFFDPYHIHFFGTTVILWVYMFKLKWKYR